MSTIRFRRRRLVAATATAALAVTLAACASSTPNQPAGTGTTDATATAEATDTAEPAELTVILPWYPTPESGGYFAAQTEGLYEAAGLDVTLQPGGPQVSGEQLVATGRAQIGHTDAAGIIQARQEGIPIVAIATLYQDNPVGVLSHADQGITSFEQMDGRELVAYPGALYPIWLEQELGITLKTVQSQGSIAVFLEKPELLQQGWPTNEVKKAEEAGVPVNFLPYSESGFNPYGDVLFTSEQYLAEHPEEIKRFLEASFTGWHDYMADVDVATRAHDAILEANAEQSITSIWYAWDKQRAFITSEEGADQLGTMTEERWTTLIAQLEKIGQLTDGTPDVADLFDVSLLADIPAPTELPAPPAVQD
ncbi:ABC transporter substrate-binding protein [Microbacterium sp. No. 7]|uniref:ABC transporter substrate-binding protein n=1 Tax=Microbacterium sp. No. 7 TaxID=1714373 RepID=UPI0006D13F7A|nr:ABC transporter substrate-binding protein [Microbacterium sp. No. 7]ALJ22269.1 hypothetical protein AOA12_21230 [Microbacterium sp. No. 7]